MANPTLTLISSQTLGSSTASVTFSSIPTSYNDLKLVASARGDATGNSIGINTKLNSDTATNYSYTDIYAIQGVSLSSARASSQTGDSELISDGASSTASVFGVFEMYFPNYNSTGSKPYSSISIQENNVVNTGSNAFYVGAHLYRGASGITSITLTAYSTYLCNFVQYSNFYLYGIKNS